MSLLDALIFGVRDIFYGTTGPGTLMTRRSRVRFIGATVTDDEVNDQTVVTFGGGEGGAGSPAGGVGDMQIHGDGDTFYATDRIWSDPNDPDGEVFHSGQPTHEEEYVNFNDWLGVGKNGQGRAQWNHFQTADATPIIVQEIDARALSVDIIDHGVIVTNAMITVTWEVTVGAVEGGGNMSCKAVFKRVAGVLELVGTQADFGIASHLTIATSLAAGVKDNHTIKLTGTGIASTVNWFISASVQYARIGS